MGTADLQELREDTEMSTGHFKRLRDVINGIKNSVPTPKPVPSASSSASSSAPKRKRTTYELKTRHETTEEVRLASLRHSTQQGYSAMVDPKKSGNKARVYGCTSVLSKKKRWNQMKKTIRAPRANTDYIGHGTRKHVNTI